MQQANKASKQASAQIAAEQARVGERVSQSGDAVGQSSTARGWLEATRKRTAEALSFVGVAQLELARHIRQLDCGIPAHSASQAVKGCSSPGRAVRVCVAMCVTNVRSDKLLQLQDMHVKLEVGQVRRQDRIAAEILRQQRRSKLLYVRGGLGLVGQQHVVPP